MGEVYLSSKLGVVCNLPVLKMNNLNFFGKLLRLFQYLIMSVLKSLSFHSGLRFRHTDLRRSMLH